MRYWRVMCLIALVGAPALPLSADSGLSSSVWVGNGNGLGLSYSMGGYAPVAHWRPGLGWNGSWYRPGYGPWRDPFYNSNDWYWQQREWEREQRRRDERAERDRQQRLTQPILIPPNQTTFSQQQAEGLATLPDNARVIIIEGKPRYEWQGQLYRFDWETQRYLPLK